MIAKALETKLGTELGCGEAEMVQRFQTLRDWRMLPLSRGRNAEHLTVDEIVSGLLSIVAERPAFAAQVVKMLRSLRPVGGLGNAFAAADTLGQALAAALSDKALLDTVQEFRFSGSEVYINAPGRAAIFYTRGDVGVVSYYVPQTAHSLFQTGKEDTYNPGDSIRSIIREIVIYPDVLQKIMRQVHEGEEHRRLMSDIALARPR
jgi:hypothetical protein